MGLPADETANAIAIAGTAFNALRVSRTGALSNWKGLAYPNLGFAAIHAAMLARHEITGPVEVFEGNKGFMDAIAGRFEIDWSREDLEKVTETSIKRYNAEFHSQSTLEAVLGAPGRARDPRLTWTMSRSTSSTSRSTSSPAVRRATRRWSGRKSRRTTHFLIWWRLPCWTARCCRRSSRLSASREPTCMVLVLGGAARVVLIAIGLLHPSVRGSD